MKTRGTTTTKTLLAALTLVFASHCAKVRTPEWPAGTEDDIFSKDEISNAAISVTLGSDLVAQSEPVYTAQAMSESKQFPIAKFESTNERLKPMFSGVRVPGLAGHTYKVKMAIDDMFVTALKVVPDTEVSSLTTVESQIVVKQNGQSFIPLFQFSIEKQGIVDRTKNDLMEDTNTLEIKQTDPSKATHLQLTTLANKRLDIKVPAASQDDFKRVLLVKKIDGKVFSNKELEQMFNISLTESAQYLVKIVGTKLNLLKVTSSTQLSGRLKDILAKNPTNDATKEVSKCSADILAQLSAELQSDCVVFLSKQSANFQFVIAQRHLADSTIANNDIDLVPAKDIASAELIALDKNPRFDELNTLYDLLQRLDPARILAVDDVKGKEFFMRRTLQDSPNTFSEAFAGSSGDLDIVDFAFEDNQVRVRKSDALVEREGNSPIDKETVMLLPATYYLVSYTDESGNASDSARLIPASPNDKGVIAYLDWTKNSIPTINSPLDFLGLEQCFAGNSERRVSDIDHRLAKDGVLNLTLSSTYAAGAGSFDCAGWSSAGYFDRIQRTFTFKERISFMENVRSPGDDVPLLKIPFEAQKVLGFGLFTYNRKVADQFGNTTVDGTDIPLPSVFDIKDGKTIKYVLAGLPQGSDAKTVAVREAITKATQDVIDDLNAGFRKALAGTAMERSSDVIELVVANDEKTAGELGDLDKNHIYYIEKSTDSGIIGLGGAHASPRNGKVASASVYLYGGNMLSEIDSLRKLEKAQNDYIKNMTVSADDSGKKAPTTKPANTIEEAGPTIANESKAMAAQMQQVGVSLGSQVAHVVADKSKNAVIMQYADKINRLRPGSMTAPEQVVERMSNRLSQNDQAVFKTLEIGKELGLLNNAESMGLIFSRMIGDRQPMSAHRAHKANEFMTPLAKLERAHTCVMTKGEAAAEIAAASTGTSLAKMSDIELLVRIWKPTLAHEIGHNLGMRHNFEGSYDKANWKFSEDEKTPRTYSSIMDYLVDDHITYDGLGPQDVASLRAAYAGVVELSAGAKKLVKTQSGKKFITSGAGQKVDVVGPGYVKIDDIPRAVGLTSWLNFSQSSLAALPVKTYQFCSDEEASQIPNCNRFDQGTTPLEIVEAQIKSYRNRYSLANFGNNKLDFTLAGSGSYIGRIFGIMMPIRQYLDETFYQAIFKKADSDTITSYVQATIRGLEFFHEVLRTPDAPVSVSGDDRFVDVDVDVDNPAKPGEKISKTVRVERKWIQDVGTSGESTRLQMRGIEFDKVISTILLTERNLGFPRYNQVSLNLSYPDVEKLLIEHKSPLELPTVGLLTEVLNDNLTPQGVTLANGTVALPLGMKAESTEMIRIYSLMGSIINLDSTGLEASDNMSRAFRVLSNFNAPAKTVNITLPGSSGDLKYFAFADSDASAKLINTGAALGEVRVATPTLQPLMLAWIKKSVEVQSAATPDAAKPLQADLDKMSDEINKQLAGMSDAALVKDMKVLGGLAMQVMGQAQQIDALLKVYPPEALVSITNDPSTTLENLGKQVPTVNLVLGALADDSLASPALKIIVPAGTGQLLEANLFRNVQILSDLFLGTHPEYLR